MFVTPLVPEVVQRDKLWIGFREGGFFLSKTRFDYQRYLASREWSLLREQVRARSHDTCEYCYCAPQQAVHHLTYERIGHERLDDLLAICNPCHEYLSGISENFGDRWFVVSPPFPVAQVEGPDILTHLAVPFDWPKSLRDRPVVFPIRCLGESCIWCPHIDPIWSLFIQRFYYPDSSRYVD